HREWAALRRVDASAGTARASATVAAAPTHTTRARAPHAAGTTAPAGTACATSIRGAVEGRVNADGAIRARAVPAAPGVDDDVLRSGGEIDPSRPAAGEGAGEGVDRCRPEERPGGGMRRAHEASSKARFVPTTLDGLRFTSRPGAIIRCPDPRFPGE